jgi:hypothetical protein
MGFGWTRKRRLLQKVTLDLIDQNRAGDGSIDRFAEGFQNVKQFPIRFLCELASVGTPIEGRRDPPFTGTAHG